MLAAISASSFAQDETPLMGWSSWNTFALNISEDIIKGQADAMVNKGFKDAGYEYLNIDDGFFGGRDSNGKLLIHPTRFPNGMKCVVDYIHAKGLKAGTYSDAGRNTCGSYFGGDVIGEGVGLYGHDQEDADLYFKELDFDFIKIDFCGGSPGHNKDKLYLSEKERYTAIRQAIDKAVGDKKVRVNACRWDYPGTWISDVADSWRTTGDINCSWRSVSGIINENLYLSAYSFKGHFNDMDMLEVGRGLADEEDKTHFQLWCMMNSPLLIGCDMSTISPAAQKLLTNRHLIGINQDPLCQQAYVAKKTDNGCYILVRDIEQSEGKVRAFSLYNPTDESRSITVDFADLNLAGKVRLQNMLTGVNLSEEAEGSFTFTVPAHGTRTFRAEAEQRLERTLYEAETGYISAYQELKNNQTERTGIYSEDVQCSGGMKANWLGYSEENDLQWRNVYSQEGGDYTMTITFISGEDRNITVSVNGKKVKTLNANSSGWDKVGTVDVDITLEKGTNVVRLSNSSTWMPDIDCMTLTKKVPTGIKSTKQVKKEKKNKGMYSLSGRRVAETASNSLPKGIYIVDGEKRMNNWRKAD